MPVDDKKYDARLFEIAIVSDLRTIKERLKTILGTVGPQLTDPQRWAIENGMKMLDDLTAQAKVYTDEQTRARFRRETNAMKSSISRSLRPPRRRRRRPI